MAIRFKTIDDIPSAAIRSEVRRKLELEAPAKPVKAPRRRKASRNPSDMPLEVRAGDSEALSAISARVREWNGRAFATKFQTERRFGDRLQALAAAGEILAWAREPIRLVAGVTWKPDFVIIRKDGSLEVCEVKGGDPRAQDRVRIKSMAFSFPSLSIVIYHWKRGAWLPESIDGSKAMAQSEGRSCK